MTNRQNSEVVMDIGVKAIRMWHGAKQRSRPSMTQFNLITPASAKHSLTGRKDCPIIRSTEQAGPVAKAA
jgi:hypothetical protein